MAGAHDGFDCSEVELKQRWLMAMRHAAACMLQRTCPCSAMDKCKYSRAMWQHVISCGQGQCQVPRCSEVKAVLQHHAHCKSPSCRVCMPCKMYVVSRAHSKRSSACTSSRASLDESSCAVAARQQHQHHHQQHYSAYESTVSPVVGECGWSSASSAPQSPPMQLFYRNGGISRSDSASAAAAAAGVGATDGDNSRSAPLPQLAFAQRLGLQFGGVSAEQQHQLDGMQDRLSWPQAPQHATESPTVAPSVCAGFDLQGLLLQLQHQLHVNEAPQHQACPAAMPFAL